jgi:RNA-binding protein YhbY
MGLSAADRRALKRQAQALAAQSLIGKAGLTEPVMRQIRMAFENVELIKLRLPREIESPDELVKSIVESVPCELVEQRGRVITLYRPRPG